MCAVLENSAGLINRNRARAVATSGENSQTSRSEKGRMQHPKQLLNVRIADKTKGIIRVLWSKDMGENMTLQMVVVSSVFILYGPVKARVFPRRPLCLAPFHQNLRVESTTQSLNNQRAAPNSPFK
jgi:hypothetical protein